MITQQRKVSLTVNSSRTPAPPRLKADTDMVQSGRSISKSVDLPGPGLSSRSGGMARGSLHAGIDGGAES